MKLENWQFSSSVERTKIKTWRLFLRAVRAVTLTVDDWVQAQELKLREPAVRAAALIDVDPVASAAREKEFSGQRQAAGAGFTPRVKSLRREQFLGGTVPAVKNGARHSRRAGAPRLVSRSVRAPKLIYQAGQFVREGGAA